MSKDAAMAELTCHTAPGRTFGSMEEMKAHYKTDWHRYNLKRKAANLPVVSTELYDQLCARQNAVQKAKDDKEKAKEEKYNRREAQSKASRAGLSFQEAKARLEAEAEARAEAAAESDDDEDEDSEGEWEEMSEGEAEAALAEKEEEARRIEEFEWNACQSLFDGNCATTVTENLEYMERKFNFRIPDSEFVSDTNGMLRYLAMKINLGKTCLHCNKQLRDPEACRKHMIDKSHAKLRYGQLGDEDAEEELEDFYSYPDVMEVEEGQLVPVGEDAGVALTTHGLEMVVNRSEDGSGGQIIGSRSLARYYKQRPRPGDYREDVVAARAENERRLMQGALVPLQRVTALNRKAGATHKAEARAQIHVVKDFTSMWKRGNKNRNLPNNVPY